jgi:hypothetical protein
LRFLQRQEEEHSEVIQGAGRVFYSSETSLSSLYHGFNHEEAGTTLIMRKQELVEAKQLYEAPARFLVARYTRSRLGACVASYQLRTTYTRIECVSCAELPGCQVFTMGGCVLSLCFVPACTEHWRFEPITRNKLTRAKFGWQF